MCLTSTRSRVCKAQWPCFVWGKRASRRYQWQNACSDRPLWWWWGLSRSLWLGSLSRRIRNGTPNSWAGKRGQKTSDLRVRPHKSIFQNSTIPKNDSYPLKLLSLTQEDQPYNHICWNNVQITKKFWQNSSDGTERILEKKWNYMSQKIWMWRLWRNIMDLTYPTFLVFELNTAKYVLTSLVPTVLVGHTNFSEKRTANFHKQELYEFYIYK